MSGKGPAGKPERGRAHGAASRPPLAGAGGLRAGAPLERPTAATVRTNERNMRPLGLRGDRTPKPTRPGVGAAWATLSGSALSCGGAAQQSHHGRHGPSPLYSQGEAPPAFRIRRGSAAPGRPRFDLSIRGAVAAVERCGLWLCARQRQRPARRPRPRPRDLSLRCRYPKRCSNQMYHSENTCA